MMSGCVLIDSNKMNESSIVSLQVHSYTFLASLIDSTLRITLQVNHNPEVVYVSPRFSQEDFPQQLQVIFENVAGFYEYLYKVASKSMSERIAFKNGLLLIKVFIDDRVREIPIRMRKMVEVRDEERGPNQRNMMLTSIASEPSESSRVTVTSKVEKEYPAGAGRLKLMMARENNRIKRGLMKPADYSSASATQMIKEYPYVKPQTILRYGNPSQTIDPVDQSRKSYTEGKTHYSRSRTLSLKKNVRENNLDLSNKDLKLQDVKEIVGYDWSRLLLLNVGYNNIGSEGLRLLTSVRWPVLKTLYACFNNISKVEWTPANVCFLKTLSLSGNKIREIPRNIVELQFLQELFIYNNKIESIPEELLLMEELKNFSIYGNKLDPQKNKKIITKLKGRKVQVWE